MNPPVVNKRLEGVRLVFAANTLIRGAMAASGSNALIGFYLASLALAGRPIDAALVGLLEAAFHAAALVTSIPFGILIDRYSPRFVIIVAAILGAIATQLFGISSLVQIFFVSRIFEGMASAGGNSGILSHLTDATMDTPLQRGRVMSGFEISLFSGVALGSLFSGPLWDVFGTQAFSLLAVCYMLAAILFNHAARNRPIHNPVGDSPWDGVRSALRDPFLRKLAPAWLAFNTVVGLWLSQTVFQLSGSPRAGQYLVGLFANRATLVGIIVFIYILVLAIGIFIWGRVLTTMPRIKAMRISLCGMLGVTFFFFLINSSTTWPTWLRTIVIGCYGVCIMIQSGFTPAALAFLADIADSSQGRGASMGIYTLLLSLGNIVGALLGGVLGQWQAFNGMLLATVGFALLGIAAVSLLPTK